MQIFVLFSPSGTEFIRPEVNVVFLEIHSLGRHVGFSVGESCQKLTFLPPT